MSAESLIRTDAPERRTRDQGSDDDVCEGELLGGLLGGRSSEYPLSFEEAC